MVNTVICTSSPLPSAPPIPTLTLMTCSFWVLAFCGLPLTALLPRTARHFRAVGGQANPAGNHAASNVTMASQLQPPAMAGIPSALSHGNPIGNPNGAGDYGHPTQGYGASSSPHNMMGTPNPAAVVRRPNRAKPCDNAQWSQLEQSGQQQHERYNRSAGSIPTQPSHSLRPVSRRTNHSRPSTPRSAQHMATAVHASCSTLPASSSQSLRSSRQAT